MLCKEPFTESIVKKLLLAVALLLSLCATASAKKQEPAVPPAPSVQETLSSASLPLYIGKQVCKWNPQEGFFGTDWTWGCQFVSRPICTATVIEHEGDDYIALTAGHCIIPAIREANGYYISDTISEEPVLRHVEVLKAESDDRYDYALIRFQSMKQFPTIPLNGKDDGPPAIGTEVMSVSYSFGLGRQVLHGVVTSDLVNVDELKRRYLTTLQAGPGASGSAIVDVKTGQIVGVLELGFPMTAMGAGAIPTGKNLFNFMEDDTAGLVTPPAIGAPPQPDLPPVPTVRDHLAALWEAFVEWLSGLLHLG